MLNERQHRLIFDMVLLGLAGALSARLFEGMLQAGAYVFLTLLTGYHPPGLPEQGGTLRQVIGPHGLWLIPISTTLGGLISGVLVYRYAPEAEGHGTDTAVKAFHRSAGFIRARVPFLKMLASAVTIGSGGAAGREGPAALITAGVGSVYAGFGNRTEEERRILVLAGMGAGLSAIFRSPIGTALFAIEVLYSGMEFEAAAMLYTMLASIVAYAVNGAFLGWMPLFQVPPNLMAESFSAYGWYVVLGLASGLVAAALPSVFYGFRDLFHKIPVLPHFKPAIGGLGVGLIALVLPQVLGGGYGWIQEAIDGRLAVSLLATLLLAKMLAFSFTVSSGGSGGVFAPSLYVGAMLGGLLARFVGQPDAAFVVIGMAAIFGGAARVPIASLFMVTEMTGGYHMLVPAALAVTLSYLVQVSLSGRLQYKSLYEAQVPRRSDSPAHYLDQLRTAFDLIGRFKPPALSQAGKLDLISLLRAGVNVTLPEGKQFQWGVLRSNSPCVGRPLQSGCLAGPEGPWEIVAVMRGEEFHLPRPRLNLRAGDRLLVVCPAKAAGLLAVHLELAPQQPGSGLSATD